MFGKSSGDTPDFFVLFCFITSNKHTVNIHSLKESTKFCLLYIIYQYKMGLKKSEILVYKYTYIFPFVQRLVCLFNHLLRNVGKSHSLKSTKTRNKNADSGPQIHLLLTF